MVSAEKEEAYCGRLGRRRDSSPHLNNAMASDDDTEDRDDNGMRVGGDYQAVVPNLLSGDDHNPECLSEKALLVWSPSTQITETKLDDFLTASKEKYGYNAEQALGMLFWHKHDLEKAMCDLPNFTPFPDEWTVEDKVLFEQAFQFHGKCFYRIRQMLPDKSIASLIKYYYSWKKTRSRTSLMDRQARKRARQRGEGEVVSEEGSNSESEFEGDQKDKDATGTKTACSNCTSSSSQIQVTPKGSLCPTCYHYWRRTGSMKPSGASAKRPDLKDRHGISKSKRKPPRGMYLNHEDLRSIANGPVGQGEAILKSLDSEVVSLKRQVQNNKQMISSLKHKTGSGIDEYRPPDSTVRMNPRWTNDELLLAVQGVRKYGKDCKAIAEVIGNKAEVHIKSFFTNYQRRYNLDAILQEYEAENGPIVEDEKMDVETSSTSNSNSGKSTPVAFTSNTSTSSTAGTQPPVPPLLSNVPPPLLKPVQSPSIMNRAPSLQPQQQPQQQQQAASRFPITRTVSHQPPPLIATSVHSPLTQSTQLSTTID